MADEVLYELRDGVDTLTMNRPDRLNAQNVALLELALAHLDRAAADDVRTMSTADRVGAGAAFFEKRTPVFRGKERRAGAGAVACRLDGLRPVVGTRGWRAGR